MDRKSIGRGGKMNNKEINTKIVEAEETIIYESLLGEKTIPYIGWFWREIDFDAEEMDFGVIPAGTADVVIDGIPQEPKSKKALVGFMANNKWDYPYVHANKKQWAEIKAAIVDALEDPKYEKFEIADRLIQKLGEVE